MVLHVGIDLHGTLLTNDEMMEPGSEAGFEGVLKRLGRSAVAIYVCTGNDLPFLHRRIGRFLKNIKGAVLETGVVVSRDLRNEELLIDEKTVEAVKSLESYLKSLEFQGVSKFARRLGTISIFTNEERRPFDLCKQVSNEVTSHEAASLVRVTFSSVAVDIIPKRFSKWTGMKHLAGEESIAAVADSMNDLEFIESAEFAFLPANAEPLLLDTLRSSGRRILPLGRGSAPEKGNIYISSRENTFAVIEALEYLQESFE